MANSCKDCKHDKGKCVGVSRAGSHRYCFEKKEMTNADRIRVMSDEELAKVFEGGFYCEICPEGDKGEKGVCDVKCDEHCLEWLKQPAEETTL